MKLDHFIQSAVGLSLLATLAAAQVPAPQAHLGFRIGDTERLADWKQSVAYFHALDAASDRVTVEEAGKTTLGSPFLVVIITSPGNMIRLDQIRQDNLRLSDPRGLSADDRDALVERGKTIVALQHGLHAFMEKAPSQTALELAYELATRQDRDALEMLENAVIVMMPSMSPDAMQQTVEAYRTYAGTDLYQVEPGLDHPYIGPMNNNDWNYFTQIETQLVTRHVQHRWRPQITHDMHQRDSNKARMFVPPYVDTWNPNVDPALIAAVNGLGSHIAARLIGEGKKGVVTSAVFDVRPGGNYPFTHGGVLVLSEAAFDAGDRGFAFDRLQAEAGYDPKRASWNFPAVWPGGAWTMRDVVDYELAANFALLDHAAKHRRYWLRNFHDVLQRAATRSEPFAFVVSGEQKDPYAAARLLEVLRLGDVEIQRATAPFETEGRRFPAGSHVVLMAQPMSAFAKMMLERQSWADPPGPPREAVYTLPLMLGVDVVTAAIPFQAALAPALVSEPMAGSVRGRGRSYALGHRSGELRALGSLLKAGVAVRWATEAFTDRGRSYPAGTLLVDGAARPRLDGLCRELGISAEGVNAEPKGFSVGKPRVGLYQPAVPNVDQGWTRFVFERQMLVDYSTIPNAEMRAGQLRDRFDVILLPDQGSREMRDGYPSFYRVREEFRGGIGNEGLANLKAFVEEGGTLVAVNWSTGTVIKALSLTATNALMPEPVPSPTPEPFVSKAILATTADTSHVLAHGLDDMVPIFNYGSWAWELKGGRAVLRYGEEDPRLSGWLQGGNRLKGLAAMAEFHLGKGRAVLFGFSPQARGTTWVTYVPLLNAIYTSAMDPAAWAGGPGGNSLRR